MLLQLCLLEQEHHVGCVPFREEQGIVFRNARNRLSAFSISAVCMRGRTLLSAGRFRSKRRSTIPINRRGFPSLIAKRDFTPPYT